jgi:hypothetical protein
MGWEVSQTNGIPTLSHDGSGFHSHANVVVIPESKWGIVVLENAENSPDEFFGSRRMSGIAEGVTSMVTGKQPRSTGTSAWVWIVYGIAVGAIAVQLLGIARSVRTLRRWRTTPQRRPRTFGRIALSLAMPSAFNLTWALAVLIGLPGKVQAPLPALLMGLPDLGYLLVSSAILALGWGGARVVWAGLILRPVSRVPHAAMTEPTRV